ncbi:unnamed protein product [Urochloa humidicola]
MAHSHSRSSLPSAWPSCPAMSLPCLHLMIPMKSIMNWSKSSLPRWVSPLVARTSKTPPSMVMTLRSNMPPPRSNMSMFLSISPPPGFMSRA